MTKEAFLEDELTQDGVLRNISIFGKAISNIRSKYPEFVTANPITPWHQIYGCVTVLFTIIFMLIWRMFGKRCGEMCLNSRNNY
jgi:uncharacterized protein with HEPN domain